MRIPNTGKMDTKAIRNEEMKAMAWEASIIVVISPSYCSTF